MKPLLSNKGINSTKINLKSDTKVITKDCEVAECFNLFFENAVNSLEIKENRLLMSSCEHLDDPIEKLIKKFEVHPCILAIKDNIVARDNFEFAQITTEQMLSEINNINSKKIGTFLDIPSKILKKSADIVVNFLTDVWNEQIVRKNVFPDELKLAELTPIFKKGDSTLAKNYRPVSVLPCISKIFERIMQKQIAEYIEYFLSQFLCGYRKGYNTQIALMGLIEKWKKALDQKGFAGAILMDLSKAFDTIDHDLLISKLNAYGFGIKSLKILRNYLSNRWQRTKINNSFSTWSLILKGVPQGSVLGPILFNIFLNDIFFILKETDICNFADDTTPNACDLRLDELLRRLEHDSALAVCWFESNNMKLNTDKCFLLISGHKYENLWAKVGEDVIWESNKVTLLGIDIDRQLKFDFHMTNICNKADRKLTILGRMFRYLTFDKKRILVKTFFESQFKYCPLVCMFYGRQVSNRINKLQERSLRMIYQDNITSFEELLEKDKSFTVHQNNIKQLMIEMYKVVHGLASDVMKDIFTPCMHNFNLRSQSDFLLPQIKTVSFGKNSIRYLGPIIWNSLPLEWRLSNCLLEFKKVIKDWRPSDCPCRLCAQYIADLGFLNYN